MKKLIGKIIFLVFLLALIIACSTLPENKGIGSLLVIKLNLHGGSIGLSLGVSSSGESALGVGSYFFTGQPALIILKYLESGELIQAHYSEDSFSFFGNMANGRYQLYAAAIDNYNIVNIMDYNIIFEVKKPGTYYMGAYVLYFRPAQNPFLQKVSDKQEEKNREQLRSIINIQYSDKGWEFE